ncbi:retropepsin-like aspartic protease family protein [Ekhidna sp.]
MKKLFKVSSIKCILFIAVMGLGYGTIAQNLSLNLDEYAEIPIERTAVGGYQVEVKVNGIKGRFVLDTGASFFVIEQSSVEKYGLEVKDSDLKVGGAGGTMQPKKTSIDKLQISNWKTSNFDAMVLNLAHVNAAHERRGEAPINGVLGNTILREYGAIIDIGNNKLYLKKSK